MIDDMALNQRGIYYVDIVLLLHVEIRKSSSVSSSSGVKPDSTVRVYGSASSDSVFPGSFIPYCNISQAQLSFHGHKDAVKFFVAVPGCNSIHFAGI